MAGGIPILALDMYEHAYHIDFGANAKAYIDAFMRNVDWKAVQGRYEDASKVEPPRPLARVRGRTRRFPGRGQGDARRRQTGPGHRYAAAHYVSRTQDIMDGAQWRDPDRVQEWAGELSKTDPVVTSASMDFTSDAKPPPHCALPDSTRDT